MTILTLACAGCGDHAETQPGGSSSASSAGGAGASSSGGTGGAGGGGTGGMSGTGGGASSAVTFEYTPAWQGVTAVTVIGGFGQPSDWDPSKPFVTLTDDGKGHWSGSAELPSGKYLYVYHVVGDAAAASPTYSRYAVDPSVSAFAACPAMSPTYSMNSPNPCSQLTVPQGAAEPVYHVKGTVTYDGKGIPGYLVELERDEMMSHHFFDNRTTTGADGSFDLTTTAAAVRLQVLHPTLLNKTDADRDPLALAALRRAISASLTVSADETVNAVDMAYHDYAKLAPTGKATLPTTFQISVIAGAQQARVGVYGAAKPPIKNIGDPWFSSPYAAATSVTFDGTFNTKQATEMKVAPGEAYFWGTWQRPKAPAGGVQWEGESMVFPITWQ